MRIITVTKSPEEIDNLFPYEDEEGQNVQASGVALHIARSVAHSTEVPSWRLPNVFDVRHGSSYVATAKFSHCWVRFLSTDGDFREGDDRA